MPQASVNVETRSFHSPLNVTPHPRLSLQPSQFFLILQWPSSRLPAGAIPLAGCKRCE
jgi:hypothetical protein